jgi:hypothetical protein
MDWGYQFWDRDSLYEEVWTTPLLKLAKKYGISDVGLKKICRKLSIPTPGLGYWAKKEAGQRVEKITLPVLKEPVHLVMHRPRPQPPPIEQFTTPAEREQVVKVREHRAAELLNAADLSHPLIVRAREVLGRSKGDLLLWTDEPCVELHVSKAALARALKFAAALITALEGEGFKVRVGNGFREQTTAIRYNQEIGFTLVERTDKVPLTTPPKGGVLERVLSHGGTPYEHKTTGRLSLRIWKPWDAPRKSWGDGKTRTIEDQLPDIVAGFMEIALSGKAEDEKRAAEKAEAERITAERARRADAIRQEEARVRALHIAAADWERADRIRRMICAASEGAKREGQSVEPGTPFADWLAWAAQQADRLDPLKEPPSSVIDTKASSKQPFRWPRPLWRV